MVIMMMMVMMVMMILTMMVGDDVDDDSVDGWFLGLGARKIESVWAM